MKIIPRKTKTRRATVIWSPQISMRSRAFLYGMACIALFAWSAPSPAQSVLRASHQFPGGKGDVRDEMLLLIAKEAKDANIGIEIQVYPGASLFKPGAQWTALVGGQLDLSLYSLDYASGMVPEFSATLMPGLIRSQERAKRINQSQFMKDIHAALRNTT